MNKLPKDQKNKDRESTIIRFGFQITHFLMIGLSSLT